jgi:3-methyladenine DNA glycosylase AlkD
MVQRLVQLRAELKKAGSPTRAQSSAWFFKTGKGQYGYGDKFIGITVPVQRKIAYQFLDLKLVDIATLLASPIHEHRFVALEILVAQYERGSSADRKKIVSFYLKHTRGINNWDLVDTSAPYILGDFLLNHPRQILYRLARSKNVWERRIAIVSTVAFIRKRQFTDTIKLATLLLADSHDLIHKATGWMLREVGKQNRQELLSFLSVNVPALPRTTLRYAIEHLPKKQRKSILSSR